MTISKRQLEERELRKERILTGALEVFKTRGLENATMEEIAEKSGFGKATLYYYFQSKEEVFSEILRYRPRTICCNRMPLDINDI